MNNNEVTIIKANGNEEFKNKVMEIIGGITQGKIIRDAISGKIVSSDVIWENPEKFLVLSIVINNHSDYPENEKFVIIKES